MLVNSESSFSLCLEPIYCSWLCAVNLWDLINNPRVLLCICNFVGQLMWSSLVYMARCHMLKAHGLHAMWNACCLPTVGETRPSMSHRRGAGDGLAMRLCLLFPIFPSPTSHSPFGPSCSNLALHPLSLNHTESSSLEISSKKIEKFSVSMEQQHV